MNRRAQPSSPSRQRGVALVFAVVAMVATLISTALAIDIGRLYFERRDLQRVANLAALDAARVTNGCLGEVEDRSIAAYNEVLSSVRRNSSGESDLTSGGRVQVGRRVTGDDQIQRFVPASGDNDFAVEVQLQRDAPARLLPLFSKSTEILKLRVVAAAVSVPVASVSVGSSLADANAPVLNDLLDAQFGGNPNLSLLGYGGLFSATADFGALAAELGVGSSEELLTARVPTSDFLNGIANALTDVSDAAVRATLQVLAGTAEAGNEVVPGEVIGVPPEFEDAASNGVFNVGAAVTALAQAANGNNLIEVPVNTSIPGVTGPTSVIASLIQPATPVIGPAGNNGAGEPITEAENAQINLQADVPLAPILGRPAGLKLWVQAAQARASLSDIECPRRGVPQAAVRVRASTNAVRIGLGEFDNINDPNATPRPATLVALNILGTPVTIQVSAATEVGSPESRELLYEGPFDGPQTQRIGALPGGALSAAMTRLASNLQITVEPAGALLNPLLAGVLQPILNTLGTQLGPVLAQLDDQVLAPVLAPLGVTVGGADVIVSGVSTKQPVLFLR